MRIDRRCWARAINTGTCTWGFKGIAKPSPRAMQSLIRDLHLHKTSLHVLIVLMDEWFMEGLHHNEVKYVATSDDYRDAWEEHVKQLKHREGCCPHGPEDERKEYERVVTTVTNDADKRYAWAGEYVDTDQMKECVSWLFDGEESLFYFVKDHPVDSVWDRHSAEWLNLDDVRGYCPSCYEPLSDEDRAVYETEKAHVFNPDCRECGWNAYSRCLYDADGKLRETFECACCNWSDATRDIDGDRSFVSKHGRPFNWPPGAPYPPRRSFSGSPMDVPPYED